MIFNNNNVMEETAKYSKKYKNPVYIVLMNGKSPLANIIQKVTKDYFSHACISFDYSLNPLYSFGTRSDDKLGFSVSHPQDKKVFKKQAYYSVYVMYVSDEQLKSMKERLSWFIDNKDQLKYDFMGLLNIARNISSENHTTKYFCSRFVTDILNSVIDLPKVASLYRPQQLLDIKDISLVNRGYDLYNYDKSVTDYNEQLLKIGKLKEDEIIYENMTSNIEKDYKITNDMKLSQFTKIKLTDAYIKVYSQKLSSLSHIRINKNTFGYIWIDAYNVVAILNIEEKDDGYKWIQAFEIFGQYKGKGLSHQILNIAIRELHATNLSVNKQNKIAIKVYKSIGFKTYKETESMYFMSLDKSVFDDEDIMEESNIQQDEIPKDIKDLLKILNSYDYGYIHNNEKIKNMNNFYNEYKSLSIAEFERYKIGVCWDYVHYEADWFKKHGYKYETFYIQVQDEDNDCPSHTYLVFYLPNDNRPYYFESSWGKFQGIEKFDNINQLHNTIKNRHIKNANSKCDPKSYFREKYDASLKSWEHLSCGDYMVKISKGKIKIK